MTDDRLLRPARWGRPRDGDHQSHRLLAVDANPFRQEINKGPYPRGQRSAAARKTAWMSSRSPGLKSSNTATSRPAATSAPT